MNLFNNPDQPTPFHDDVERLVNKGAVFSVLNEDERAQAIREIERLMGRTITIAIATWADWWTGKNSEDRKLAIMAITQEAVTAFDELGYKH